MFKNIRTLLLALIPAVFSIGTTCAEEIPVSSATAECLECHGIIHPGIVEDWRTSRHAMITPSKALAAPEPLLRVSGRNIPEDLRTTAVGCAECHTRNATSHRDTFEHNGYDVHVVVSPKDCQVCHTTEEAQYAKNIMSHAWKNLAENKVYQDLQRAVIGTPVLESGKIDFNPASEQVQATACYYCHGTRLEVTGTELRDSDLGEMEFPVIRGWPNQGVGRINPDDSRGSCSACHTRHSFSIEIARKPETCKECHEGPDVPAYKVYRASKHGNIYSSISAKWDFTKVPWTIGEDFTAPTCAACHISRLDNTDGDIVAQRTHQMSDRLSWRIFGLVYAHPQPANPDTTLIKNREGFQLPTNLDGTMAASHLIDRDIQKERRDKMTAICLNCHGSSWVNGHFQRYEHVIQQSNASVQTATQLMDQIWRKGLARGPYHKGNLFDEAIERKWVDIWLFYANSVRFTSAMGGGGDYAVFANGNYSLSQQLSEMVEWYAGRTLAMPTAKIE
ncbi:MAG: hydroxylamine oxidase [Desulfobacteraceae bacterium]|nr:hydroxylamine oxidase [Desulfobacteraceae bacterium]